MLRFAQQDNSKPRKYGRAPGNEQRRVFPFAMRASRTYNNVLDLATGAFPRVENTVCKRIV